MFGHPVVDSEVVSGLCYFWEGRRRPFPHQSINLTGRVIDTNACMNLTQNYTFTNQSTCVFNQSTNQSIECVYVFPLDEYSAVYKFDCMIDSKKVEGVVKPKKVARQEYNDALINQQSAALLEQQQENVFEVRIGALKQSNNVTINLSYLTVLTRSGPSHQLIIPMIVAPKYVPYPTVDASINQSDEHSNVVHHNTMCASCHQSPIIGIRYQCTVCTDPSINQWCQDCESSNMHDDNHPRMKIKTNQPTDESNNQSVTQHSARSHKPVPPHIAARETNNQSINPNQSTKSTNQLPHAFSFNCMIEMASDIKSIECPSHPNMVITRPSTNQSNTANVSLMLTDSSSLQRDLILSINQSKPFEPRCMVEYDSSVNACSVSLSFDIEALTQAGQSNLASEYVFLLDRSGSMSGESIDALKQSMQLLIKSLPVNSRFQIISFGSSHSCLFPEGSVLYNDETCERASAFLSTVQADMGGTEIAAPLQYALTATRSDLPRNVFIVTDGQVSNIGQLVSMVAKHRADTRLFTIGIGSAVDRALCRKLARAGAGECEFVSLHHPNQQPGKEKSDMRSKVLRQLGRAMQPMLTNVSIDWGELSKSSTSQQCPQTAPAMFPGTRFGIYLLDCHLPETVLASLKGDSNIDAIPSFEYDVVITARSNQANDQSSNPSKMVKMSAKVTSRNLTRGSIVSRLAARARIAELEQQYAETPFGAQSDDKSKLADIDQSIESLAMRFGLASRATSFIVVFDKVEQAVQTDAAEDVAPSQGFHQPQMMMRGFGGAPRMKMMSRAAPMAAPMAFSAAAPMAFSAAPMMMACAAPPPAPINNPQGFLMGADSTSTGGGFGGPAPPFAIRKDSGFFGCFDATSAESASLNQQSRNVIRSSGTFKKESSKESETLSTDPNDLFDEIVLMQSASGAWKLTEKLVRLILALNSSIDQSKFSLSAVQAMAQSINQPDEVISTLIVVHLLKQSFADRSDDWQFMASKAEGYANQRCDQSTQQTINQKIKEMGF